MKLSKTAATNLSQHVYPLRTPERQEPPPSFAWVWVLIALAGAILLWR